MKTKNVLILKKDKDDAKDWELLEFFQKEKRNWNINIKAFEDLKVQIQSNQIDIFIENTNLEIFDSILLRVPHEKKYDHIIETLKPFCKKRHIKLINSWNKDVISSNKLLQYAFFAYNKIPIVLTYSYHKDYSYAQLKNVFGEQFIFKDSLSSKGKENYLIKTEAQFNEIVKSNKSISRFIVQKYIPNTSDFRVTVIGGKVVSIIKRERIDPTLDHRNNTSIGAKSTYLELNSENKELIKIAKKVAMLFNVAIIGVDILVHDNKYYVLEGNFGISLITSNKVNNLRALSKIL